MAERIIRSSNNSFYPALLRFWAAMKIALDPGHAWHIYFLCDSPKELHFFSPFTSGQASEAVYFFLMFSWRTVPAHVTGKRPSTVCSFSDYTTKKGIVHPLTPFFFAAVFTRPKQKQNYHFRGYIRYIVYI